MAVAAAPRVLGDVSGPGAHVPLCRPKLGPWALGSDAGRSPCFTLRHCPPAGCLSSSLLHSALQPPVFLPASPAFLGGIATTQSSAPAAGDSRHPALSPACAGRSWGTYKLTRVSELGEGLPVCS